MTMTRTAIMRASFVAALTICSTAPVGAASAQVFTPTYQAPRSSSDLGIYLADGPGDFSVEAVLRRGFGGYDLGLRGGIADTHDDASILLGADLRNPLSAGTAPIDLAFTAGVQAALGDVTALGLQAGLSLGHTFLPAGGGFSVTPYIHPRIALVDSGHPADDFDLDLAADLGFDFVMTSGLILRLGINLSDPGADWGVGLAWR